MDDLACLSLREAVRGIREGLFSSEQLTARYLQRAREYDGRIHAWTWLGEERALAHARVADRSLREGGPAGVLHGVGLGIKDIIDVQGVPTGMGSPIFNGFVPNRSAACVENLERAGAFVLGKTATTEFANQHPATTTNPWDAAFTPGGSSSGSAAAVAAGFTAAAVGSQTRGSTIRPAVYCGIVGFKPSFGLLSRFGVLESSGTLDHVGVLARSIDDAGLLVSALMGHDARDLATVQNAQLPTGLDAIGESPEAPRIAAVRTPLWSHADEIQRALFDSNCYMMRNAGARLEHVELRADFTEANHAARVIQLAEIARNFADLYERAGDRMSATFRELCERGARVTPVEYSDALELRSRLQRSLDELFTAFDAIVTPPATGEPPKGLHSTGDAVFCTLWTLCGVPSVAFPTALGPQGLPMGLQVVGGYLNDRRLLEIAQWCVARLPFDAHPLPGSCNHAVSA